MNDLLIEIIDKQIEVFEEIKKLLKIQEVFKKSEEEKFFKKSEENQPKIFLIKFLWIPRNSKALKTLNCGLSSTCRLRKIYNLNIGRNDSFKSV